jgi:hypothetical protein
MPVAIILDTHQPFAACRRGDDDAARPGVDGVLDQFLDHAGGPLHHLAGGNAVDQVFG